MGGLSVITLRLSHFRSHRLTELAFDGRPVVLVGPNGAGKTNILEALSLLSPGRGLRRAAPEDLARRPEAVGWKVTAGVRGLLGPQTVETWAGPGEGRQVRIDDKAATQAMLGRTLRLLWLVPAMDRLWIEAAEGRRRFLDRMTLSFRPDHADLSLAYEKAMRDRNRLLKDQVRDPHWFTALETRMGEAATGIAANRAATIDRLRQAQEDADSLFPAATLTLVDPEPVPGDLAAALASGRSRDMAAGRTLVGPHRTDLAAVYVTKNLAADQCSTGEQKALLLSLLLANARALAEDIGRAPLLLLDEVAAHLDGVRRAALYDEIAGLGAQAVMTGTEADLFDPLGPRGQRIEVADDGDGTRIRIEG